MIACFLPSAAATSSTFRCQHYKRFLHTIDSITTATTTHYGIGEDLVLFSTQYATINTFYQHRHRRRLNYYYFPPRSNSSLACAIRATFFCRCNSYSTNSIGSTPPPSSAPAAPSSNPSSCALAASSIAVSGSCPSQIA